MENKNNKPIVTKGCLKYVLEALNSKQSAEDRIIEGSTHSKPAITVLKLQNNPKNNDYGNIIELDIRNKTEEKGNTIIPSISYGTEIEACLLLIANSFAKKTNKDNYYSNLFFWTDPREIKFYENGQLKETFNNLDDAKQYARTWGYKVKTHLYVVHEGVVKSLTIKGTGSASWINFNESTKFEQNKFKTTFITSVGEEVDESYHLMNFDLGREIPAEQVESLKLCARMLYYFITGSFDKVKALLNSAKTANANKTQPQPAPIPETKPVAEEKKKPEVKPAPKPAPQPQPKAESEDLAGLKPYQIKDKIKQVMPLDEVKRIYGFDVAKIFNVDELISIFYEVNHGVKVA